MTGVPDASVPRPASDRALRRAVRRHPRTAISVVLAVVVALVAVSAWPGVTRPAPGPERSIARAEGGRHPATGPVVGHPGGQPGHEAADAELQGKAGTAGDPGEETNEELADQLEQTNGEAALLFRGRQLLDENGEMPPNALVAARKHVDAMRAAASKTATPEQALLPADWEWLGPGNIGGRIRTILVHPTDPQTLWIGSATGGIFKTSDGGGSWTHLDDFMANLAVVSLVSSPSTPDVIYAATGEYAGSNRTGGNRGAGVFRSLDGGTKWDQVATTAGQQDWWYTNRLAVNPTSPSTLLAATWTGIFRTTDGGDTPWTQVLSGVASSIQDVDFDPVNGANAIAGAYGGQAYYSTNGGVSWLPATGLPGTGRVEVAYYRGDPSIVYASVNVNGGAIYKSTDGGHSYAFIGPGAGDDYLGNQGNYANALWVSPTNVNRLIVGGLDLYQSTDGGATLVKISDWTVNQDHVRLGTGPDSAHADQHAIVANATYPTDTTVYFGNDGGIYKASATTVTATTGWQELNNNLGTTQFYGAAGSPTSGRIIGGAQDNGTLLYTGTTEGWTMTFGGDGGFSAADQTNASYMYGEYVYGAVTRSSDGGATAEYISGITGYNGAAFLCAKAAQYEIADACNQAAAFIAPIRLDPGNAQRLLVGGLSLWRTNDARTANTSTTGPTWTAIKPSINDQITAIAIDPTNSNNVYVGHKTGYIYRSTNATAATPTWNRVDTDAMPSRMVLGLTVDPNNPSNVYALFSGFSPDNVWLTTDGGLTWNDRTGSGTTGLPDVPARSLVVHPGSSAQLYLGTELGVFTSQDGGASWSVPGGGPANVPVDELFVMNGNLVAATFGRGLFRAPLAGAPVNTAPTISNIADRSTPQDTSTGPIAFTIGDAETASTSLTLSGGSSNQGLVPNANIIFGGSGANRTVTVTPAPGQSGSTTVTVTVSDGALSASDSFVLTVTAIASCTDDAREPDDTIGTAKPATSGVALAGMACDDDFVSIAATTGQTLTASLAFSNAAGDLDMALYTAGGVQVGLSDSATDNEQIVYPVTQTGTYFVRVYPYNGAVNQNAYTLTVTVPPLANTAPTISDVANRSTTKDTATGPIGFTVGDAQTAAGSLVVSAASSNQAVVPNAKIVLGGSGASRTVTITPAAGATGTATITLSVSDGSLKASDSFVLTVTQPACPDDAREPNNGLLTATPILAGVAVAGMACDDDFFSIAASVGQTMTARLEFTQLDGNLDMRLYDAGGAQVGSSLGATDVEQIVHVIGTSGRFYVRVYPYLGSANQNAYTLTVKLADTAPPVVIARSPASGATGVVRDVRPLVTFNEALDPATVTATRFRIRDRTAGTAVTASVAYDAVRHRVTLRPATLLAPGHRFTVYVANSVRDVAGNAFAGMAWSFTVTTDGTRPTIVSRRPARGATGVSRTANVLVTFSERMRASTITTRTVRLRDASTGALVTAVVTYDATLRRATLNPSVRLAARRYYTVLLSSSIRDRAGNRLSSTSWSFKTGS